MAETTKFVVNYKCECCGETFVSHRTRTGEKLCAPCIELRRALKGFLKHGLDADTVLKRGRKLLGVKANKKAQVEPEPEPEPATTDESEGA